MSLAAPPTSRYTSPRTPLPGLFPSMKLSLSGSRTLAVSIIAALFSWAFGRSDTAAVVARYQKLSKDAILAQIASRHTSAVGYLSASLFFTISIVVGVDLLTRAFDALGRRIGVASDGSAPVSSDVG